MISYVVEPCARTQIRGFVEENHYSASINGVISDYCFALRDAERLIGAAIFGRMAMAGQYKRFSDNPKKVIELRRLCCIDDTLKNTESFFIARCLKWLRDNTEIDIVVSYADEDQGHQGTIYKASNFAYLGFKPGGRIIAFEGKQYHDKAIRAKHKGILKPFAQRLIVALDDGRASYVRAKGKHCFTYTIRRKGYKKHD